MGAVLDTELRKIAGTLVPSPDFVLGPQLIDGVGTSSLSFTYPPGVPTGFKSYQQFWFVDPGVVQFVASSNGLETVAP